MKVFNHKETEFIMINIPEILVANGTGAFLVLFLLLYRIRIAQTNPVSYTHLTLPTKSKV